MVSKSKGNQKALQVPQDPVFKTTADNRKALEIIRRLRKGHSLKPLWKEARNLAQDHKSAISQLCLAKVELARAVDGLMNIELAKSETRPAVLELHKEHFQKAMSAAHQGALLHSSILCGRFYYRLAVIVEPSFASLNWPHVNTLADPQTELLEQVDWQPRTSHHKQQLKYGHCSWLMPQIAFLQDPNVCEFETWKEWKGCPSEEVKLKMRIEMETVRKKGSQCQRQDARAVAAGLVFSGLLYESHKQHLTRALVAFDQRLQNHDKILAQKEACAVKVTL